MRRKLIPGINYKYLLLPAVIFLAELFVFNYRHWVSLENREIPLEAFGGTVSLGSGYRQTGERTYLVTGDGLDIILEGIDQELKTACIKIQVSGSKNEDRPVVIRQSVTDESHRLYYDLPKRELWAEEERSAYMIYHLYGKCGNLKIVPKLPVGAEISFSLSLNPVIPLFLSWERMLALFFLSALVCLLRPSSRLHRMTYLNGKGKKRICLLLSYFVIHGVLFLWLTGINPYFRQETGENQEQYQKLAESLAAGKFFIMEEPAEALKTMENPYDYAYRNQLMEERGEWYLWDSAYFEGKYYVYFGVIPAVLFYLPCYLLTGRHLPNHTVIFFLSLCFLLGVLGVVHELIRKWFPKISLASWFLVTELLLLGSNIIYMTKRPDLYTVPILSGLSLGMLGLWCFLRGIRERGFSCGYIALGSLLTAGIAGCRPQLFVFVFPALLLLKEHALSNCTDRNFSAGERSVFKMLVSFIVPMLLVAAALMYYNYSRFGSVFDFGANYNLTFNDMRRRGFHFGRLPLGMLAYLFQPVKLIQQFPFTEAVYFDSQYMGETIQEATYGGIFRTNFFTWLSLLPIVFHGRFKKYHQTICKITAVTFVAAMAVIVIDTNMSGILMRYFSDFSIFLMLSASLSALTLLDHFGRVGSGPAGPEQINSYTQLFRQGMIWGLLLCLLGVLFYQGMIFFLDTGEALRDLRPDLYSHMKYLTAFWL